MKDDDIRDQALGALLREAAETAAGLLPARDEANLFGTAGFQPDAGSVALPSGRRIAARRVTAWIAAGAALAAGLAAVVGVPVMVGRAEVRELVAAAAGDLSRSLISDTPSLLAELPTVSEVESAAADWAGSLMSGYGEL